jgi:hypothetical protein
MVNKLKKYQGKYYFWNYKCQNRWSIISHPFLDLATCTLGTRTLINKLMNFIPHPDHYFYLNHASITEPLKTFYPNNTTKLQMSKSMKLHIERIC